MPLLKEKYKTWEGARKRAGFENGVARSEYERGYKAKLYHYTVVQEGETWRVQRDNGKLDADFEARVKQAYINAMDRS